MSFVLRGISGGSTGGRTNNNHRPLGSRNEKLEDGNHGRRRRLDTVRGFQLIEDVEMLELEGQGPKVSNNVAHPYAML